VFHFNQKISSALMSIQPFAGYKLSGTGAKPKDMTTRGSLRGQKQQ